MLLEKTIKVNSIAGGIGFILSLIVGIISGGSFLMVLIRALSFGVIFFVFMEIFQRLIGTFLPELLNPSASSEAKDAPGSRVDISVEDGEKTDLFQVSEPSAQEYPAHPTGSFADDVGTLDQLHEKDYTQREGVEGAPSGFVPEAPLSKAVTQGTDGGADPFFSTDTSIPGNVLAKPSSSAQDTNRSYSKKNLDPLKMASAIQTILKQE
ncbi:MAG: hypothetical protein LBK43_06095 [Treponema sp.]|jgi:hypothetical protein|nr:hypothetical protein [Treponema sp.]